jgi:hypothetical protein
MLDGAKWSLWVGGTVLADCQQAVSQTSLPFPAQSIETFPNYLGNCHRHAFSGQIRQFLRAGGPLRS